MSILISSLFLLATANGLKANATCGGAGQIGPMAGPGAKLWGGGQVSRFNFIAPSGCSCVEVSLPNGFLVPGYCDRHMNSQDYWCYVSGSCSGMQSSSMSSDNFVQCDDITVGAQAEPVPGGVATDVTNSSFVNTHAEEDFWPPNMPHPHGYLYGSMHLMYMVNHKILEQETPVQVFSTSHWDQLTWNCIAYMSDNYLNAITREAPMYRTNIYYQSTHHRVLCAMYAYSVMFPKVFPHAVEDHENYMTNYGLDRWHLSEQQLADIDMCIEKPSPLKEQCIQQLAPCSGVDDRAMSAWVGALAAKEQLHNIFVEDGNAWNVDGSRKFDFNKGHEVECKSGQCTRYGDYTGYEPVNTATKLNDDERWQPLIEDNDIGFVYAQEHVTPQAGQVPPMVVPASWLMREAPDPMYNYAVEDQKVIDRVAALHGDDLRKAQVEVLDDKTRILGGVLRSLTEKYPNMSHEQYVHFIMGYTAVEHDAVAVTWKEKTRHNRIRPTSRVRNMAYDAVTNEPVEVDWHDGSKIPTTTWTPYIRVMPHAEYPSGSTTICYTVAEYTDLYVQDQFGIDTIDVSFNLKAGTSKFYDMGPKMDIPFTFTNMTDLAWHCAQSRLWGGMHYTAAVDNSIPLIKDFGRETFDYVKDLLGGDTLQEIPVEYRHDPCNYPNKRQCTKRQGRGAFCKWSTKREVPTCIPIHDKCKDYSEMDCMMHMACMRQFGKTGKFSRCRNM